MRLCRDLSDLRTSDAEEYGGKAANLGVLFSIGLAVPQGFAIAAAAAFPLALSSEATQGGGPHERDALVDETNLPPAFMGELHVAYEHLGAARVAVRSSATVEDAAERSFAGIFDSYLDVDAGGLLAAIIRCWHSAQSERARVYCIRHGIDPKAVQMGVIVQEMIDAELSGVCFTQNPVSGRKDEIYIETVQGTGEGLASGRSTPTSYIFDTRAGRVTMRRGGITDIGFQEMRDAGENPEEPSLSESLVHALAKDCMRIHLHFGRPQDIEFAVCERRLYYLQARPITANE